jgi:hypothetical protein
MYDPRLEVLTQRQLSPCVSGQGGMGEYVSPYARLVDVLFPQRSHLYLVP